jgi:hypothetical protein
MHRGLALSPQPCAHVVACLAPYPAARHETIFDIWGVPEGPDHGIDHFRRCRINASGHLHDDSLNRRRWTALAPKQRHILLLWLEIHHASTWEHAPASPIFDNSVMLC